MASILKIGERWRAQVRPKGGKGTAKSFATEAEAREWADAVERLYKTTRPVAVGWRDIVHHALQRTPIGETTGIYFLFYQGACVYVGKSANVYARLEVHFREKTFDEWAWVSVPIEELTEAELHFIRKLKPALNVVHNRARVVKDLSTTPRKAA